MLLTVLKSSHYHSSGQGEEFSSVFLLRKIAARCELLKKYTPPPFLNLYMASTIVTLCVLSLDLSLFIFRLCLCKCWPWSKDTWGRGSHTDSFRGALPLSWSLIRWAHTQHVPLVSSAWLALPPEIKDGWGAAVLMERRVERVRRWWWWRGGCYKKVGGNGWRVRVWL